MVTTPSFAYKLPEMLGDQLEMVLYLNSNYKAHEEEDGWCMLAAWL